MNYEGNWFWCLVDWRIPHHLSNSRGWTFHWLFIEVQTLKSIKSLHNLNLFYFSYTSLLQKKIRDKIKKFTQVSIFLHIHSLQVCGFSRSFKVMPLSGLRSLFLLTDWPANDSTPCTSADSESTKRNILPRSGSKILWYKVLFLIKYIQTCHISLWSCPVKLYYCIICVRELLHILSGYLSSPWGSIIRPWGWMISPLGWIISPWGWIISNWGWIISNWGWINSIWGCLICP